MRFTEQDKPRRNWIKVASTVLAIFIVLSLISSVFLPFITG